MTNRTKNLPQITDPNAVVFLGDGEPSTPASTIDRMQEYQTKYGYDQDHYLIGGTVETLEKAAADLMGVEATLFTSTGTLANHLAVRRHCGNNGRAITQEQSHLFADSGDTLQRLSGINLVPLAQDRVCFTIKELREAYSASITGRVLNSIGCVVIESPVRRQSGQIVPFEELRSLTSFCREQGIPTHLDGARLFMMSAATGIPVRDYVSLFDSTYISTWKYFGAPFGAILAGNAGFIEGLYHDRRMFGGSLPSASLAAGLTLEGVKGFEERFTAAMDKARSLFNDLNQLSVVSIQPFEHHSNIFPICLAEDVDMTKLVEQLKDHSIFIFPPDTLLTNELSGSSSSNKRRIDHRTTLTINTTILRQPNETIVRAFKKALR